MSGELTLKMIPYYEPGILNVLITATANGFSGFAEIYTDLDCLCEFGTRLTRFPVGLQDSVEFEYGSPSGEYPYHLVLRAQVMDAVGHSALHVRMQSLAGAPERALVDLYILSEPSQINGLGQSLLGWILDPMEPLVWTPRA